MRLIQTLYLVVEFFHSFPLKMVLRHSYWPWNHGTCLSFLVRFKRIVPGIFKHGEFLGAGRKYQGDFQKTAFELIEYGNHARIEMPPALAGNIFRRLGM